MTDLQMEKDTVEVPRELLSKYMEWAYFDSAIDSAPDDIKRAEDKIRALLEENTESREPHDVFLRLHGIDPADLPSDIFKVGAGDYPRNGCDHLAHEVATAVHQLIQEEYNWEVSGVSLGVGSISLANATVATLEDAKKAIEAEYNDCITVYDYGNSLRFTNGSAAMYADITREGNKFRLDGHRYQEEINKTCPAEVDALLETLSKTF